MIYKNFNFNENKKTKESLAINEIEVGNRQ